MLRTLFSMLLIAMGAAAYYVFKAASPLQLFFRVLGIWFVVQVAKEVFIRIV